MLLALVVLLSCFLLAGNIWIHSNLLDMVGVGGWYAKSLELSLVDSTDVGILHRGLVKIIIRTMLVAESRLVCATTCLSCHDQYRVDFLVLSSLREFNSASSLRKVICPKLLLNNQ